MASDFATNPTTTTTYDDVSYAAIITDEVLDALMAAVVTPPLLDQYDIMNSASKSVKIPKADKFTAASVAEGVELANTALTSTSVTITAAEIGIQATVTDVLEVSDIPAAHGARLRQLGRALGDKLDIDICALLSGFSTSVGSTGVDLSLANVLDAIYNLEVNDAAGLGGLVAVLHPRQTADIRTELEADQAVIYTSKSDSDLSKASAGWFGNWFGIDFYQSTNVATANAGADRAGGLFVRDYALGMVQKWTAKVEVMRWAPIRGFVLVAHAMYGVGEVEDAAGVAVVTDA
jgi:N4-gp56 family major capsid protein